ncbi:MAG: hypothetical protein U9Q77_09230 [Candidatus Marinimicrobia bacterium]|nr:hypothetical protein [Candidatus Neomarinimicrobiota bacterium]
MDFSDSRLDFKVKTLLIHALRSEAGILKQHFPQADKISAQHDPGIFALDHNYDLVRTGVGLDRSKFILEQISNIKNYNLVIHFGVSGALDDKLQIHTLIRSHQFKANGQHMITLDPLKHLVHQGVKETIFFSSQSAVIDEVSREQLIPTGAGAVDMESYSVAEFCQNQQLPLLAIRCISDRAGHSTSEDFRRNYNYASKILQDYLLNNLLKPLKAKS